MNNDQFLGDISQSELNFIILPADKDLVNVLGLMLSPILFYSLLKDFGEYSGFNDIYKGCLVNIRLFKFAIYLLDKSG